MYYTQLTRYRKLSSVADWKGNTQNNRTAMLQITGSGKLIVEGENLSLMRDTFAEQQLLRLPDLIEPPILKRVLKQVNEADFFSVKYTNEEGTLGEEMRISPDNPAIRLMSMLLNNPSLFQVIQQITNCSKIRSYLGRIRREQPNTGQHLSWHNDPDPKRLIAISINLSTAPYSGGLFQMREKASKRVLAEITNTGLGDAVIFQVCPDYEHRTYPVVGSVARTTCAGWFYSEPDFLTLLLSRQQKAPIT